MTPRRISTFLVAMAVHLVAVAFGLVLMTGRIVYANDYDPLAVDTSFQPAQVELIVHDGTRHRDIPVRFYLPTQITPGPVVLFSHGLGGSRSGSAYLGKHWAARGYVVIFIQHPGSDDSVWKDDPSRDWMSALQQAASLKNFLLRVQDVPVVLDQLKIWNEEKTNRLSGRLVCPGIPSGP
jgi:predicted dienelactone hydrolase